MDWITLVVVALAVLVFVAVGILLRRLPRRGKRPATPEERAAMADVDADAALARGMTDKIPHPRRR